MLDIFGLQRKTLKYSKFWIHQGGRIYLTRCSWGCSTNTFVIHWVIHWLIPWSFSFKSSTHYYTQTVRARKLKFWKNVHLTPHVTCHMSHFMCHMTHVMCHISHVTCHLIFYIFFLLLKLLELVGRGSVISYAWCAYWQFYI